MCARNEKEGTNNSYTYTNSRADKFVNIVDLVYTITL